ncbi:MAG: hypothetical protein ACYS6W_06625 [Planctomycetota bacterium]|jgi:hypothetical protein
MDNFDSSKISGNENLNAPIPFDDDDKNETGVSHSPLTLGGSGPIEAPKVKAAPQLTRPVEKKPQEKIVSSDQITGIKTFFTKLHPGALQFLDEQIGKWLKENPGVTIKRTNVTTGNVQAKKTEPNIIITVWY